MDGVGCGRRDDSDAVWLARTPTLDLLGRIAPTRRLIAHGKAESIADEICKSAPLAVQRIKEVALRGLATRVAHFEQPVFAWR